MRPRELDCLFEPISIGKMELKNRLVMAPMGTGYGGDGYVTERLTEYLTARARGGVGLITVEVAFIHSLGKAGLHGELGIDDDKYIPKLKELSDAIHKAGSKVVIQLNHAGRYSRSENLGDTPVAPSAIPSNYTGETPRELNTEEVEEIVEAFAEGARRAKDAGFDGVELMGSTGYLISQFCSHITNKRTDKYGGETPEKRATFVKEIIESIRKKVGDDISVCVKMSVDEYLPGGNTIEDSKIQGKIFSDAGADRLHAWAGWHESPKPMLPMSVPRAAFAHLSAALKEATDVPVTAVGRINDPFVAASLIKEGKADLVAIGRGMLSDPEFANKANEGRADEIRTCIGCCICFDTMMSQIHSSAPEGLICAVNPELGREYENLLEPVKNGKNILIIGGGPAGMEAARITSIKGHKVTIWEKSDKLGGSLNIAEIPPFKEEIGCLTRYLSRQMELDNNIKVELNKEANVEDILNEKPDIVIMATGSKPHIPDISGIKDADVVLALDVLNGKAITGENVAILGGGLIGVDVAEFLHEKGKNVTLLTRQNRIGDDIGISTRWVTMMRIRERKITLVPKVKYKQIKKDGVLIERKDKELFIPADTIVISGGLLPNIDMVESLACNLTVAKIGDCVEPRKIKDAIHEGFDISLNI
ncbi:MAG: FAD-dependent oxidoreductase [Spirochaetota bacterium]|nr:FAD-dependent oxidoreductase [Spirochaetota bacterium]